MRSYYMYNQGHLIIISNYNVQQRERGMAAGERASFEYSHRALKKKGTLQRSALFVLRQRPRPATSAVIRVLYM